MLSESDTQPKIPPLRLDHLQTHRLELRKIRAHAILRHETVVAAVIGLADGGVHAHLRGHAGHDELLDASVLQDGVQVGREEGALAWLVNHRLRGHRVELGNDVVPGLAANENAAHRPSIADARLAATTNLLGRRQVTEVGTMALARVHHRQRLRAPPRQQLPIGFDDPAQLRHIVAQHLAKAARFEEITLHVDEEERAAPRGELEWIRFRLHGQRLVARHDSALMNARESATAPNTPPCIVTILSAARWFPWSVAPVQSESRRHS